MRYETVTQIRESLTNDDFFDTLDESAIVLPGVMRSRFFIVSQVAEGTRRYTIHAMTREHHVQTVGEPLQYASARDARAAIAAL